MSRLIIISNRLPIAIEKDEETFIFRQSSGGLVAAISAYLIKDGNARFTERIWMGVSECPVDVWEAADKTTATEYKYQPIFIAPKAYDQYYNGFSNSVLWPLFHYFPSFADYQPAFYEAYLKVNFAFSQRLAQLLKPGDTVWIHDYHLLPLAGMLRKEFPNLTIGFFLHIPFPSYELFRVIPREWQLELLKGMLGADLIGFHTQDYQQHFLNCVKKVLPTKAENKMLHWNRRTINTGAFPIGIDFDRFHEASSDLATLSKRAEYLRSKQDKRLIFSVDRLDYTKGVFHRLKGYREFLMQNPQYKGKVIFALVIVPSRDTISKYAERKKMIDEYIGNFNSTFGSITWQPILYQYGHLSFEELVGLYTACDLALITPLRDGMNLVAKEFVASRRDRQGVLVLSEMAGAANELTEALLINPNDRREIAQKIREGLEMSTMEQEQRITAMQERIKTYDVVTWAKAFFAQLDRKTAQQPRSEPRLLDNFAKAKLLEQYTKASQRLLLLDYDGTLVPFCADPQEASPSHTFLLLLTELSADPKNKVYIISGRDSSSLENWLGHLPIGLIAEHGLKIRHAGSAWMAPPHPLENVTGFATVDSVMQQYVSQCPGSFIEKKDFSLAWHYRGVELNIGSLKAGQLHQSLLQNIDLTNLSVLNGHKVVEVKSANVNKGEAVRMLSLHYAAEFILCVGDDQTDEDMFRVLQTKPNTYTIKVGSEPSLAGYNLLTPYLVHELLQRLVISQEATQTFV